MAFRGCLNDTIYTAAENEFLRRALNIHGLKSKAYQQMLDAELVLRFLTLREDWDTFSGSFSRSMDQFMLKNVHIGEDEAAELVAAFTSAIGRVEKLWGDRAFKRWDGDQWRQQALAGLYDAQMIACDQITASQFDQLRKNSKRVIGETRKLFADEGFEEAVRLGTNTPSRMKYRVKGTLDSLTGLL